ncbi:MAG: hypothetical protein ABSG10_12025 [Terracidiphilus sp.]|jgi:NAD(P)-dependent dehydrogenase (short-subunit alcohol dehydrogenase family)
MLDPFSLKGKAELVTGSSRGLGAGIAVALDRAGAVAFLASSASDTVHSHILVVNGGWLNR